MIVYIQSLLKLADKCNFTVNINFLFCQKKFHGGSQTYFLQLIIFEKCIFLQIHQKLVKSFGVTLILVVFILFDKQMLKIYIWTTSFWTKNPSFGSYTTQKTKIDILFQFFSALESQKKILYEYCNYFFFIQFVQSTDRSKGAVRTRRRTP